MRARRLVGGLKGFLQPEAAFAQLDPQPLVAQFAGQNQRGGVQILAQRRNKRIRHLRSWGGLGRAGQQGQHQPVLAHGKADARRFGPADGLAQPVVAAAAEQGILRAQAAVGELEGGAGVVVQAAHQPVIARVRHAGRIQRRRHRGKVRLARLRPANRQSPAASR